MMTTNSIIDEAYETHRLSLEELREGDRESKAA